MKKKCSKCKEEKELDDFYKCEKNKDGYQGQCKSCIRFANKKEQRLLRVKRMNRGTWDCPDKVVTPKEELMKPQVKESFILNAF